MQTPAKNTQVVVVHSTHVGSSLLMAAQRLVGIVYYSRISLFFCVDILLNSFFLHKESNKLPSLKIYLKCLKWDQRLGPEFLHASARLDALTLREKGTEPPLFEAHTHITWTTVLYFLNFTLTRMSGPYHLVTLLIEQWTSLKKLNLLVNVMGAHLQHTY